MPKHPFSLKCTTPLVKQAESKWCGYQRLFLLTLIFGGIGGFNIPLVKAQPQPVAATSTAPQSLRNTLAGIDAAANRRDLQAVMQFYSPNFSHGDGLTRQAVESTTAEFWKRYNTLKYTTQVQSWKPDGNGFVVETLTNISGNGRSPNQAQVLKATIRARQQITGQKILRQDIVSERSQVTSGAKPPTVELRLPRQVQVGKAYNFDVIVKEPLGNNLLLGAALEEPVNANKYLQSDPVKLATLSAGGIFKVGIAPAQPTSRWLSAVLIRDGGMTLISQRLQVVARQSTSK